MDITSNQFGAMVDITADAFPLLDQVALAYAADPDHFGALLMGLANARAERDELIENPGVDRSVDVIESAEIELAAAREALVAELPGEPVTFTLAETDCRRAADRFLTAAEQTVTAIADANHLAQLMPFPHQRGQEDAA